MREDNSICKEASDKVIPGCRLCPRNCGAARSEGKRGFCGETDTVRVARAALHMWEEPCISGTRGSGTVFFTGCVLRCVFCQNHELADSSVGLPISVERLAEIFLEQQERGANNINLVTPTHFVPQIIRALTIAKDQGLTLPVLYNTGSYETVDTIRSLEGLIDIWLPDLKYMSPKLSAKYSAAPDYPEVACAAITEMVRQAGEIRFAPEEGTGREIMTRGVIVRHLMLPGFLWDSEDVVRYLYETYGDRIYMSLMNQYTPMEGIGRKYPELDKKVRKHSYEKLIDYALNLGVTNAFIQEGETAKESFIPEFDYEGVLHGTVSIR